MGVTLYFELFKKSLFVLKMTIIAYCILFYFKPTPYFDIAYGFTLNNNSDEFAFYFI